MDSACINTGNITQLQVRNKTGEKKKTQQPTGYLETYSGGVLRCMCIFTFLQRAG